MAKVGRVTYSEPFCARIPRFTPLTAPEALPKLTINPRGCRQSSEVSQVSAPTPSYTTGHFLPSVSSSTRLATSSRL
ncbi:hypothetical protein D3C73_1538420 [compost metagenome]